MNEPSVIFYDPAPVRGYIDAVKEGSDWDLTGFLEADSAAFDVFWMPGERVILHNPTFTIWDNLIQSNVDDCTVLDLETLERIPGRVSLYLDLSDTLSFEGWGVDVWAYDGKEVGIRLPMPESNVDIWGTVSGHLVIQSDGRTVYLGGDLTADDLTMSLGMEPLPEWWGSDKSTRIDFNLLLRENVKFVFPLGPDPILTATLAENQRLHVIIDEYGGMDISGSLNIRSGEFFYFQKNFYITEGNLSFPTDPMASASFNPVLSLRARLRDFDSEGNPIEGENVFALLNDLPGAYAAGKFPVFETKDGRVVIPVTGMGLWGPIWGYVALEKDMNTIAGIIMAHKGETPGLGDEIATAKYQSKFIGKQIFNDGEFVSVKLRKGGAQDPEHEVDAISGGTKTSDGVTAMLHSSIEHYLPLLEAKRAAATAAAAPAEVSNVENEESNE